jgi:hypothetical protein
MEPAMEANPDATPARLREAPLELLRKAAGSPREMAAKLRRLGQALVMYVDGRDLDARLRRLADLGYIERIPNRIQLLVGARDMLKFWIVPAAADYYEERGIDFTFHQILRFLDEPASLVDPTGFLSTRDNIIGHLMQVVHANPAYDLQLLESHEDGLEELERQVEHMIAGTHPRARSIGAIVEDPDYHRRLLEYVREFRRHRDAEAPLRNNVTANAKFRAIERTFGTLPSAMRYFAALPADVPGALHYLRTVQEFPGETQAG